MSEATALPVTSIRSFAAVPNIAGRALIRLPRCSRCFEEIHDCIDGVAHCAPIEDEYSAMSAEQRERWDRAERDDRATVRLESD